MDVKRRCLRRDGGTRRAHQHARASRRAAHDPPTVPTGRRVEGSAAERGRSSPAGRPRALHGCWRRPPRGSLRTATSAFDAGLPGRRQVGPAPRRCRRGDQQGSPSGLGGRPARTGQVFVPALPPGPSPGRRLAPSPPRTSPGHRDPGCLVGGRRPSVRQRRTYELLCLVGGPEPPAAGLRSSQSDGPRGRRRPCRTTLPAAGRTSSGSRHGRRPRTLSRRRTACDVGARPCTTVF